MAIKLKVKQVKSGIGRPETQRKTLVGLGLGRPNMEKVLVDTVETRGMIRKVSHLVKIEAVE